VGGECGDGQGEGAKEQPQEEPCEAAPAFSRGDHGGDDPEKTPNG